LEQVDVKIKIELNMPVDEMTYGKANEIVKLAVIDARRNISRRQINAVHR